MKTIKTYFLSEKTYSFLIAAFLVSIPLPYAFSTTLLIVLLALSIASSRYHKIVFKKELLLPIVFYIFMVWSLLWTTDIDQSLRGLERQLSFLLIPLAFIFMPPISMKVLLRSFYVFAISIFLVASILIFIGMGIAYLVKTSSLSMLLTIFLLMLLFILSSVLAPSILSSSIIQFFIMLNPFVLLHTLLTDALVLGRPLMSLVSLFLNTRVFPAYKRKNPKEADQAEFQDKIKELFEFK